MKKIFVTLAAVFLMAISGGTALADLDGFLSGLNNQARADRNEYGVRLSVQFGVPLPQVHSLLGRVQSPADAFMCLQLGRMVNMPPERVFQTYSSNRGKGWGVIAKELGIKPGSAEFHALKRGDFAFTGQPGSNSGNKGDKGNIGNGGNDGNGKGQGKGKGKGHNK
jgi:hypothetical protein